MLSTLIQTRRTHSPEVSPNAAPGRGQPETQVQHSFTARGVCVGEHMGNLCTFLSNSRKLQNGQKN